MKLPVSYKEFVKQPIVATLFIVLCGISALYLDVRSTFQDQAKAQNVRIEKVENRLDLVQNALRKSDSLSAVSTTKLQVLTDLKMIPK
jgi:sensor domain CHASE-containing protein